MSERSDEIPVRGSGMIFFTAYTTPGMSEQSDEIPVRDWLYSVVLVYIKTGAAYAYLLARALPAGTRDVGA